MVDTEKLRIALVGLEPTRLTQETREAYRQGMRVLVATNRVERSAIPLIVQAMERLSTTPTSFIRPPVTNDTDIFGFLKIAEPAT